MFDPKSKKPNDNSFFLGDYERSSSPRKEEAEPKNVKRKPIRAIQDLSKKEEQKEKTLSPKKPLQAKRNLAEKENTAEAKEKISPRKKPLHAKRDLAEKENTPEAKEKAVLKSLDGMYGVYQNTADRPKKTMTAGDYVRYAVLFVCIFGFFLTGYFVFRKFYDYYRAYVVYSGLQEMVEEEDRFADDYMKKTPASNLSLSPLEIFDGKTEEQNNGTFSEEQESLVRKISQLKKINADTVGWIRIDGTVVNYPVVRSNKKDYYLRRDFYGKVLSGGSIYVDNRNSKKLTENQNTVIYGHNMADGSMFASIHDFTSASVFYNAKIEITTEEGVFIYTPFSVHESHQYDNYFETNFVSDEDFVNFCEQIAFLSIYETNFLPNSDTRIITLSTCMDNESATEQRFAVHAYLTEVIR